MPEYSQPADRVCVVTGASSGLGRALVRKLASEGASVAFLGRDEARMEETRGLALGFHDRIYAETLDLRDRAGLTNFFAEVERRFGPVDTLINNAGVMYLGPFSQMSLDDISETIEINLLGALTTMAMVVPGMVARGAGAILNISSIAARNPGPAMSVYAGSKAGLGAVSESLRQELAPSGIRVMCVQLGAVDTPLNDKIRDPGTRRFIKAREKTYTPLPADEVAAMLSGLLATSRTMAIPEAFILPINQVS